MYNKERLRDYSSVFSTKTIKDIVEKSDYRKIDSVAKKYDYPKLKDKATDYYQYLRYLYQCLIREYKCEYIYKNAILNDLLIKKYGVAGTIALNEFRVNLSIVDMALFNGESKAFEIKTDYDSDRRLKSQMYSYSKLFQECYLIIHTFHALPSDSDFDMFRKCRKKMNEIPDEDLNRLFIEEIKKRPSNTPYLKRFAKELRAICLSANIKEKEYSELFEKLNEPIIICRNPCEE